MKHSIGARLSLALPLTLLLALPVAVAGCRSDGTYGSCVNSRDCTDPLDTCYEVEITDAAGRVVSSGRFCSRECGAASECDSNRGFGAACYGSAGGPYLCYQRCVYDSDCYGSSVCVEVIQDATGIRDFVCAPDA